MFEIFVRKRLCVTIGQSHRCDGTRRQSFSQDLMSVAEDQLSSTMTNYTRLNDRFMCPDIAINESPRNPTSNEIVEKN